MKGRYAQLITELDTFPRALGIAVAGLSESQLRRRPAVGEFSILENVAHVRDLELEGSAVRIRRVLSENKPVLLDFDGTAVAAASSYNDEPFADAFTAFRLGRRRNIARLAALTEPDFMRTATFGDRNVTLAQILELLHAHDAEHRAAIEALASRGLDVERSLEDLRLGL